MDNDMASTYSTFVPSIPISPSPPLCHNTLVDRWRRKIQQYDEVVGVLSIWCTVRNISHFWYEPVSSSLCRLKQFKQWVKLWSSDKLTLFVANPVLYSEQVTRILSSICIIYLASVICAASPASGDQVIGEVDLKAVSPLDTEAPPDIR